MSEHKHTPGPWWYNGKSRAVYAGNMSVANCTGNVLVANCGGTAVGAPAEDTDGNCRLIAASPALLSIAESVATIIEQTYAHDEDGNRVDGDSPLSAADVVDALLDLESVVDAAIAGVQPPDDDIPPDTNP